MPLPQDHVDDATPMGATPVGGGVTFRLWAPHASAVHVLVPPDGGPPGDANLLQRRSGGDWTGFVAGAAPNVEYLFHVVGDGSAGPKRDPYARELSVAPAWPDSRCVITDDAAWPWHDAGWRPPPFHELVILQLHVGAWSGPDRASRYGTFLDVVDRLDHLVSLGVNAVQLLPVVEFRTLFSMGYNGTDYFSPEMEYEVPPGPALDAHLARINGRLAALGRAPIAPAQLAGGHAQLKALIDLAHLAGVAVHLDVVYNHAGGGFDDGSMWFLDRQRSDGGNRNSLYFSDRGWAGGLVFEYGEPRVRQFLIDHAVSCLRDLHADGLRLDEVSVIDRESEGGAGWLLCQDLADTARYVKPEALLNAEYWPVNPWVVKPRDQGGAGFDATQHDGLRDAVRAAVRQASWGMAAPVDMGRIGAAFEATGLPDRWRAVTCVENHDLVYAGREPRLPALADPGDRRSWWARSRSRVAAGLLLAAPGIPMLFMGQELLEDKPWDDDRSPDHLVWWGALEGQDRHAADFLGFVSELVALRRRTPALTRGEARAFHANDGDWVLACHRWIEGEGGDVVVIASLNDATLRGYRLGLPGGGGWRELLNSDLYDFFPNPWVDGNGGRVEADGGPLHGMPASGALTLPANAVLILAR